MALRIETNPETQAPEIVIDGFELGIADSPYVGISDLHGVNADMIPKSVVTNYNLVISSPQSTSQNFAANSGNNTISWSTPLTQGQYIAVSFSNSGGTLPSPLTAATLYYLSVGIGGTLGSIYDKTLAPITLTTNGSGTNTFSSTDMVQPKDWVYEPLNGIYYVLDKNGLVWTSYNPNTNKIFRLLMGTNFSQSNLTTNSLGNGIALIGGTATSAGYLLIFTNNLVYYYNIDTVTWSASYWNFTNTGGTANGTLESSSSSNNPHLSKFSYNSATGSNNNVYVCDGNYIAAFSVKYNKTFLPTDNTTYLVNTKAVALPTNEIASCLEDLNANLQIGTSTSNVIYPWDYSSPTFGIPILVPEIGTVKMLNVNRVLYITAGRRGNLYYSTGANVVLFKSLPNYLTGNVFSIYTFGGLACVNNNLLFGISSGNLTGVMAINLGSGATSIGLTPRSLRYENTTSQSLLPTVIIPLTDDITYFAGSGNNSYGAIDILDTATPTYFPNAYVETDLMPVGTANQPTTFNRMEVKFGKVLAQNEGFTVYLRNSLSASYTQIFTYTQGSQSDNAISYDFPMNFSLSQWLQAKVVLNGVSGGNLGQLREIRIKK